MRRLVFPVMAAFGLLMAGSSSAFAADPTPTVSVPATKGKEVCQITDKRLDELSGLVATKSGFVVVNDSTEIGTHKRIFFLNTKCKVVKDVAYSGAGPRDPEDLILSPDGQTLWIADIGDNNFNKDDSRPNLTLWTMPADGSKKPVIHRVAYPAGVHHDAEALLLTGDGIPLIITKEIGKSAVIYRPSAPLQTDNAQGVPLEKVGEIAVAATETPGNPYSRIGNKTIDGAAIAPGGGKVVLRTYTDALEFDVTGNDVLTALQKQKPRTTGLPNEFLGEAITYSADGKTFYTVSDMSGDTKEENHILSYTPATTVAAIKKASAGDAGGSGKAWYSDLTIDEIMYMVGGVGLLGLLLVATGVLGITRHRRRIADLPPSDLKPGATPGDPETELIGVGGPQRSGGVYGGAAAGPAGPAGGAAGGVRPPGGPGPGSGTGAVYGGGAAQRGAAPSGGVYGGGAGGTYGRPPGGGQARGGGQQYGRPPGGGGGGGQQGGGPRPPQGNGRPPQGQGQGGGGQRPQSQGLGGGGGQRPQGQRSQGVYGQPSRPDGSGRADGFADRNARPEGRFDNPGYRR